MGLTGAVAVCSGLEFPEMASTVQRKMMVAAADLTIFMVSEYISFRNTPRRLAFGCRFLPWVGDAAPRSTHSQGLMEELDSYAVKLFSKSLILPAATR